jgi:hypothetical protein
MAGGHGGGHGYKHYLHIVMLAHGFTLLPASLVFLVYSTGNLLLHGEWRFFLLAVGAIVASVILFTILSIASE